VLGLAHGSGDRDRAVPGVIVPTVTERSLRNPMWSPRTGMHSETMVAASDQGQAMREVEADVR
jgi:hypothetical protein